MRKLLLFAILCFPFTAQAQSLDAYGGRTDMPCTNASGYYRLFLFPNGRHWLCTPSGNGQFAEWLDLMTTAFFTGGGGAATTKYSGYGGLTYPQTYGKGLHDDVTSWNFNGAGFFNDSQFSGPGQLSPTDPAPKGQLPWLYSWEFGKYAQRNLCGIVSEPIKDSISPGHAINGSSGFFVDVYDTNWVPYLNGILTHRGDAGCNNITGWPTSFTTAPYLVVQSFGESDTWTGQGSPTIHPWTTWLILGSELIQTGGTSGPYSPNQIYSRTTNYTKQQFINSLTTEYGTISALNTAWGSTYTQFATTGTSVSGEAFGTGDGSTVTFNHTLAHTPVDTSSISILVGGALVLGDIGNGTLTSGQGATVATGTITYSTGAASVTFTVAPANGAAITANYNFNGYCHGTGLSDECGTGAWMGNALTLAGETAAMQTDMQNLMTTLWSKTYQTQHDAIRSFDPNHMITAFLSPTTDARTQVLLPATNACSGGPCIDIWLAPTQSGISSTSSVTLQPLSRIYDLTGIPILSQSPYLTAETDSALSGTSSNGPDCVSATTQALRGMNYFTYVSNALALKANDGTYPIVGTEYWGLTDNSSAFCNLNQVENLGIATAAQNTYNGVEPASGAVSCSAPLNTLTCGSEPAPGGSGVRPFGNYIGNASAELMGVKAANGLWLGAPTTRTAPSFGSFP